MICVRTTPVFLCLISIVVFPLSVGAQSINGLQVDDTGNVGIGRSNPVEDLHIDATSGHNTIRLGRASYLQESDGLRRLFLGANVYDDENNSWTRQSTEHGAVGVDLIVGARDGSFLRFVVDDAGTYYPSERMRITETGDVGIGTSSPSVLFHVAGRGQFDGDVRIVGNSDVDEGGGPLEVLEGSNEMYLGGNEIDHPRGPLHLQHNTANDVAMVEGGGSVGIGTSSPNSTLDVHGMITESSARRFKTEVEAIENASALVNQLRGVRYRWKENGNPDVGFIAEEVEQVLPSLVSHTEDGKAKSLNYSHLTSVLVEALKEQTQRTDSLQQRLEEQCQQIEWQKAQANLRTQHVRQLERQVASLHSLLRKHGIEAEQCSACERHGSENE